MYSEMTKNNVKSIFFLFVFLGLIGVFAGIIGLLFSNIRVSFWIFGISLGIITLIFVISSWLAVKQSHGVQLEDSSHPRAKKARQLTESLSITLGLPTPKLYYIPDRAPNAFAGGLSPKKSFIGVTHGLLNEMDDNELEGVIAHELAHIKNFDVRYKMVVFSAVFLFWVILDILALASRGKSNPLVLLLLLATLLVYPWVLIAQAASSRTREYAADVTSVDITRYPEGLAQALTKIKEYDGSYDLTPNHSVASLHFINPFRATGGWVDSLLSTHPPVDKRIERLRALGF